MPEDGFPELKRLYALVGKPDAVQLFPGAHFPHNYNHVARVAMYGWVNQLFGLGLKEPILERDFELVRKDQLTVWDAAHPQPASGIDYERELTRTWAEQIDAATRPAAGDSPEVLKQKRDLVAEGWRSLTAWSEGYRGMAQGNAQWSGNSGRGPVIAVRLTAVPSVGQSPQFALSVRDPLAGELTDLAPLVKNPRPAAAFTYGYNAPPVIRRVGVLLDAFSEQRGDRDVKYKLIVGDDQILLAAAAALQWPEGIASIEWATEAHADFDPLWQVESIRDPQFIPSALRFQGLQGLLATLGDRVSRVATPRP